MKRALAVAFVLSPIVVAGPAALAQHATMSDKALMSKLQGRAWVLDKATIMGMGADGKIEGRQGGNQRLDLMDRQRACAPTSAPWNGPGGRAGPPPQSIGFIYMLRGDTGAAIPTYATKPAPDNNWSRQVRT
jgi:hypothetical protein